MNKLNKEEVKELVTKISLGLGDDKDVSLWIQSIMDSVPNRNVIETIMSGEDETIEQIVDKLYTSNVIQL